MSVRRGVGRQTRRVGSEAADGRRAEDSPRFIQRADMNGGEHREETGRTGGR